MRETVQRGSAGTAENLFRVPLVVRSMQSAPMHCIFGRGGELRLPYSVTTPEGKHWSDDDGHPYPGLVLADDYAFRLDHQVGTPTLRSLIDAARATIDPIVANYQWVLTLKRTSNRDHFKFWIAPEQGHPNAPYFQFCDDSNWSWEYLFPPGSQHHEAMVAARARD